MYTDSVSYNGRTCFCDDRLNHDGRCDPDFLGLPLSEKMEIGSGDDDRLRKQRIVHAQQSLLIGRKVTHQREELFGQGVARYGPKPCPGAAGQQNGDD